MSISNGYYTNYVDNFTVILKHIMSGYKKLCKNDSNDINYDIHFGSRRDYDYFCSDIRRIVIYYNNSIAIDGLFDVNVINIQHWTSVITITFDNDKTLVYNCDGIYTFEEQQTEKIEVLKKELKACKVATVKAFAKTFKERLSKFIWKHNIPECIFNDVMDDLLKEYENEQEQN